MATRAVLRGVSLTLAPGSFHFLVGASGRGQDDAAAALLPRPDADRRASIRHFGRAIRPNDRNAIAGLRRAVGVVQQDCQFLDHLPLAENIALPLQRQRHRAGGARPRTWRRCSHGSSSATGRGRCRRSCPAASGSGRRWRAR